MTRFFLSFFSLALFSKGASAHHVYGIEVSPFFEVVHSFAEPSLFALSGACLAAFLLQRVPSRLWATLAISCAAIALATASVIEEGAGLFLLWDALAGTMFFALARSGQWGLRRKDLRNKNLRSKTERF